AGRGPADPGAGRVVPGGTLLPAPGDPSLRGAGRPPDQPHPRAAAGQQRCPVMMFSGGGPARPTVVPHPAQRRLRWLRIRRAVLAFLATIAVGALLWYLQVLRYDIPSTLVVTL